jgi:hypothetical protein
VVRIGAMAVADVFDVRLTLFHRQLFRHLVEWMAEMEKRKVISARSGP